MTLALPVLRARFVAGELSPVELTRRLLARAADSTAFATIDSRSALAAAQAAEDAYRAGDAPPLAGIPIGVKDLVDVAGMVTGCGSALRADAVARTDAPVVAALRAAGAVILGKTRTHEFAWGVTSEPTGYGPCRNPHDPARIAGGSSGGSAVAVAEELCTFAIGTDTAGSVRIPAALCGIYGLRPTTGSLSATGVFPLAPSFDVVGVLAGSAADVRAGWLASGPGGTARPAWDEPVARIGLLHQPFQPTLSAGVAAALDGLDVELVELPLSIADDPAPAFAVVQGAEALAVHKRHGLYPAHAEDYDLATQERLLAAAERSPEDVEAARAQLAQLRSAVDAALSTVDVAVAPVHATVAPRIGDAGGFRAEVLPFTIPQSVAGVPSCAVPAGADGGLPVGIQVCASRGLDDLVLATAAELGRVTTWPS